MHRDGQTNARSDYNRCSDWLTRLVTILFTTVRVCYVISNDARWKDVYLTSAVTIMQFLELLLKHIKKRKKQRKWKKGNG